MNFSFLNQPAKKRGYKPDDRALVIVHEPPHNTNEGSEYLDDAIRMKEQPLMYTEESVAVGCPEGILQRAKSKLI